MPRDKLYTNPSFVVSFLNPSFSLIYLKVYYDTKLILIVKVTPIKLEQIWPKKYISVLCCHENSATELHTSASDNLRVQGQKNITKIRPPCHPIRRPNCTSRNPILSHFHNIQDERFYMTIGNGFAPNL